MLHKLNLIFVGVLMATFSLSAQEVITAQGDYFTASNGSLSWTLGEPITETFSNGSNDLTQGFQQTKLIATLVNNITSNINIQLYPNPVANYLTINLGFGFKTGIYYNLMDNQGKLIKIALLKNTKSVVDFSTYAKGVYLLNISSKDNQIIKTYKVIKQ